MNSSVLLDTHVVVWLAFADRSLGPGGRALVDAALKDNAVYVSAISFFEIATLRRRGCLHLYGDVLVWRQLLLQRGIAETPIQGDIAIVAGELNGLPGDPADRIIAATALVRGWALLTADDRILQWTGPVTRHDARR
ncbi:MAG: type II toxin-antitoxin system VapC family toxin [Chloroflexi bacterium]|nr:type II toxin-antitoxin system VapC family toxin [Chloroflexota bacterium]